MEYRTRLKAILGIQDDNSNDILDFILERVHQAILIYCRTEELPNGLKTLYIAICADLYRAEGYGSAERPRELRSITEGDISLGYGEAPTNTGAELIKDYKAELERYRRCGW